jgi:transposase InsO family protein
VFVDDYSRHSWIFFLKQKSEVYECFKKLYYYVKTQFKTNIQIFRSDSGGEFVSKELKNFFGINGIIHQKSCPYTPQQNDLAERKHRHIVETTRTLLVSRNVPKMFWAKAALTAVYLINRMPSKTIENMSPIEKLFKISPDYKRLRVFGCKCFVLTHRNDKLSPKAISCVFLGYAENQKGYRCYDMERNKLYVSRNVTFLENEDGFSKEKIQENYDYSFLFYLINEHDRCENIHNEHESENEDAHDVSENVDNGLDDIDPLHTTIQTYTQRTEDHPPCALERYSQNQDTDFASIRKSIRIFKAP